MNWMDDAKVLLGKARQMHNENLARWGPTKTYAVYGAATPVVASVLPGIALSLKAAVAAGALGGFIGHHFRKDQLPEDRLRSIHEMSRVPPGSPPGTAPGIDAPQAEALRKMAIDQLLDPRQDHRPLHEKVAVLNKAHGAGHLPIREYEDAKRRIGVP